MYKFCLQ